MFSKTTRFLLGLLIIIGVIYWNRVALIERMLPKLVENRLSQTALDHLQDGLHVVLCGAGSPIAAPNRSGPCVMVIAGTTIVVIDVGSGGARNIMSMNFPVGKIETVFLTHFHSDHIDGLGELAMQRWVNVANTQKLPVIGPSGLSSVIHGFNLAYSLDSLYRNIHHSDSVAPLSGAGMQTIEIETPADKEQRIVYSKNGLVVTMFAVDHTPVTNTVGYKFEYKGRTAVISGDTVKSTNLQRISQNIDLLVHEALAPNLVNGLTQGANNAGKTILKKITTDILDYHATPVEVAEIAQAANVRYLLYYHIVPALIMPGMEAAFLKGVNNIYKGPITIGIDGTMISMPADSSKIKSLNLF